MFKCGLVWTFSSPTRYRTICSILHRVSKVRRWRLRAEDLLSSVGVKRVLDKAIEHSAQARMMWDSVFVGSIGRGWYEDVRSKHTYINKADSHQSSAAENPEVQYVHGYVICVYCQRHCGAHIQLAHQA